MATKSDKAFPEIWVVPATDQATSQEASRAVRQGSVRRIFPGLYTGNLEDSLEKIVQRNLYQVMGTFYPGAVLSHRTAFHGGVAKDGQIFATSTYNRNRQLVPELVLHLMKGPARQPEDIQLPHGAFMSSEARMFLENMQVSRPRPGSLSKTVTQKDIEERLIRTMDARGQTWLNELRDAASVIAKHLGWNAEYQRLYSLVGRILGTQKAKLMSPVARARSGNPPYDLQRVEAFDRLAAYLRTAALPRYPDTVASRSAVINEAFFEAYFSNFIEGTKFDVAEAKSFVLDGVLPKSRPTDAHDIIGTYQLISDQKLRARLPADVGEFINLLQERNETLMRQRLDKRPGLFKEQVNVVGSIRFVEPELVRGTLQQGFMRVTSIPDPLGRATYMMFLISEVHPFDDGNGRVARLFMNAELSAVKLARIIIPIVFRDDYMTGIRTITRNQDDAAYVRMLVRAQDFSRRLDFVDYNAAYQQLKAANAFEEPNEAKLVMPSAPDAVVAIPDKYP